MLINRLLAMLLLLFTSFSVWSYDNIDIELDSGIDMNITRFEGEGETLVLWLPSEYGFGQGYISVALNLSLLNHDIWAVQLHDSYVVPTGRQSLNDIEIEDLVELIDKAKQKGFKQIFLLSSSRGVILSLKAANLYQQLNRGTELLKGLLLFSPHLIQGRTEMGKSARYEDIAAFSNLPVYMLQPQYATKFARSQEIAQQLNRGGSQVYMHVLRETQAGFYMRPDEDLTERDIAMRDRLPVILDQAINILKRTSPAKLQTFHTLSSGSKIQQNSGIKEPVLHAYSGDKIAPSLTLNMLNQEQFDLNELKGSVVLVNFWATWCAPCVEEIPSLSRLVAKMKGKPFKVVAVNIGESVEDIKKFTESIPVNFDILLDKDGEAVRDWKVYAYPSNYLIDQDGLIQYAYRGALQWDAKNIVNTIDSLFD